MQLPRSERKPGDKLGRKKRRDKRRKSRKLVQTRVADTARTYERAQEVSEQFETKEEDTITDQGYSTRVDRRNPTNVNTGRNLMDSNKVITFKQLENEIEFGKRTIKVEKRKPE